MNVYPFGLSAFIRYIRVIRVKRLCLMVVTFPPHPAFGHLLPHGEGLREIRNREGGHSTAFVLSNAHRYLPCPARIV
jgi:hypothetical protein